MNGGIRTWICRILLPSLTHQRHFSNYVIFAVQVQYTNAMVLLVGDTHSGKTGLAHRLATGEWKPSDGSTVGAWSTQWKLKDSGIKLGVEREIWLWDFGGQSDQRLIHQLLWTALHSSCFSNADQEYCRVCVIGEQR
jgi:GTPase SAR1 family protein